MPILNDYLTTVKSGIGQRIFKLEILDQNENIISTISPKVISGDLQLSSDSGSRRSCNVSFDNSEGDFTSNLLIGINTRYKLYTGMMVNDEPMYFPMGIFVSGEPEVESSLSSQIVSLTLYDKYALLDNTLSGVVEKGYVIIAGTPWDDAIRQTLLVAGEIKSPIIQPTSENLDYNIVIQPGETYGDILSKLCLSISYVIYYDNEGFPRLEPPCDIDSAGSVFDFTTNENIYLGSKKRYEYSKVRNSCVVTGTNNNIGVIYRGTIQDTDPTSPTNVNLIGVRSLVISDDTIASDDLALQRAKFELDKVIQVVESISCECIPLDHITPDQVITIYDPHANTNGRYLIKSLSLPLVGGGNMSLSVTNARSFLNQV